MPSSLPTMGRSRWGATSSRPSTGSRSSSEPPGSSSAPARPDASSSRTERRFAVQLTRPADTWVWIRPDLVQRLAPMAVLVGAAWLGWRGRWLGLAAGDLGAQLTFGLLMFP